MGHGEEAAHRPYVPSAAASRTMPNKHAVRVCVCRFRRCQCAHVPAGVSVRLTQHHDSHARRVGEYLHSKRRGGAKANANANLSVQQRATPLAYIFRDLVPSSLSRARSISLWWRYTVRYLTVTARSSNHLCHCVRAQAMDAGTTGCCNIEILASHEFGILTLCTVHVRECLDVSQRVSAA